MAVKNLAIIPARSGSKGLPHKNIKMLGDKPLIAYTIEAAIHSNIFDEVMVSTDSVPYKEIALRYGAKVPFLRSESASTGVATSWDVVKEVIHGYQEKDLHYDMITLLQPTTPLRTSFDIVSAYTMYLSKNANAIVSVCEVEHSPLWTNTLPADSSMDNFLSPVTSQTPRQALPTYYRINGAIYMFKGDYFMNHQDIYHKDCFAYVMRKEHSIDIDDEFDFKMASILMEEGGRVD